MIKGASAGGISTGRQNAGVRATSAWAPTAVRGRAIVLGGGMPTSITQCGPADIASQAPQPLKQTKHAPAAPPRRLPPLQSTTHRSSGWAWVQPFDWTLWLALGLTLLVLPLAVFVLELLSLKRRIYAADWAPGLQESLVRWGWERRRQAC